MSGAEGAPDRVGDPTGFDLLGHGVARVLDRDAGLILSRVAADRGVEGLALVFLDRDATVHCFYPVADPPDAIESILAAALDVVLSSGGLCGVLVLHLGDDADAPLAERQLAQWRRSRAAFDAAGVALVDWLQVGRGWRSMAELTGVPSWWRRDRAWRDLRAGPLEPPAAA